MIGTFFEFNYVEVRMKFIKMQGAGNDYVYVDCTKNMIENPSEMAIRVSDVRQWNKMRRKICV